MTISLLQAAEHFIRAELAVRVAAHEALEMVGQRVEKTARAEFGVYQPGIGPFGAWPELADSTKEERERLGYSPDEPLLREGDTRDSIRHETSGLQTAIGSDSDVMVYQEFGTEHIPPRPVLGPAALRNEKFIVATLGGAVMAAIIEGDAVHHSLGYGRVIEG